MCVLVSQSCVTLCDPMDCSPPVPLSMGFTRQEYWSGLPFPSPGDIPDPGTEPEFPELAGRFFTEPPQKPQKNANLLENSHSVNAPLSTLTLIQSLRHL